MRCQCGRGDADRRGVTAPVLLHENVEAAVADEEQRRGDAKGPAHRRGARLGERQRWPSREPVYERSAGTEQDEEGQRHAVVAGALEQLPYSLAGKWAQ